MPDPGHNGWIPGTHLESANDGGVVTMIRMAWGGDEGRTFCTDVVGYHNGATDLNLTQFNLGYFQAIPELEVEYGKQHGGTKDVPVEVMMREVTPLDRVITGEPFAPIWVTIYECDPYRPDSTIRLMWHGKMANVRGNYEGRAGAIKFSIQGHKARWDTVLMGLPSTTTCPWILGDKNCCKDLSALRETVTVDAIDGKDITVTGLTTTTSRYWQRGYLRREQLRIGIRDYTGGSVLTLLRAPPAWLVGESIILTPGCDKTLATCRSRFANEEQFGGFGYSIPPYNPTFQSGR